MIIIKAKKIKKGDTAYSGIKLSIVPKEKFTDSANNGGLNIQVKEDDTAYKKTLADLAVEEYRFMKSYSSAVSKTPDEYRKRFISAYNYHERKLTEFLEKQNMKTVIFDGKEFDEGLPVAALNADDFDEDEELIEELIIEQTIEPTVLTSEGDVIKMGTVILAKKPKTAIG